METQKKPSPKYSPEVRERAVRLVFDHADRYSSQWEAVCSIAAKIGCSGETLRKWVRQAERDQGRRPGATSQERERIKELEREVRELRQAVAFAATRAAMENAFGFLLRKERQRAAAALTKRGNDAALTSLVSSEATVLAIFCTALRADMAAKIRAVGA